MLLFGIQFFCWWSDPMIVCWWQLYNHILLYSIQQMNEGATTESGVVAM